MATSPTLPPMAYADQQGVLKGLRIELGYEIAKRLCLKPEYISTEYATMVPGLQGGRWDMINAGLFVTAERRKILFMIPMRVSPSAFQRPSVHPSPSPRWTIWPVRPSAPISVAMPSARSRN